MFVGTQYFVDLPFTFLVETLYQPSIFVGINNTIEQLKKTIIKITKISLGYNSMKFFFFIKEEKLVGNL